MKIGFIGIGKLGLDCAEAIAKKGFKVYGYDVERRESQYIEIVDSIQSCVQNSDTVFVSVPTPHDKEYDGRYPTTHLTPKDFDYSIVKKCLKEANIYMNKSQQLILISTVLPGTTRREFINLVNSTNFLYNPYLIAMGSVSYDMVNPEMVIIGTEDGKINGEAEKLINFYKQIMENNPRYEVGNWDEAECIKIFYNTFISAKISLVNMIQDIAVKQGNINSELVCKALSKSNLRITGPQYMMPGMGDGGACHPRDNIALRFIAEKLDLGYDLFDSIMNAREIQAENLAKFAVDKLEDNNAEIFIHGKAYKPKVEYVDGSYSVLVGHYIEKLGKRVVYIDPLTEKNNPESIKGVIILAHSSEITYKYTNTEQEDKLYCKLLPGSIVIDPWRKFEDKSCVVHHYGNSRY